METVLYAMPHALCVVLEEIFPQHIESDDVRAFSDHPEFAAQGIFLSLYSS